MSVAVYPRLGELLRARNLTVAELEHQIEQRFGISVEPGALGQLAASDGVRRADLEVAGAVAGVLGIGLNDLFEVALSPAAPEEAESRTLTPEQERRLGDVLGQQSERHLSQAEQAELDTLVAENGRNIQEKYLKQIARQRGINVEQARQESDASLQEAVTWWREIEADPTRYRKVVAEAKRR